jgi:hypothetical protein
MPEELLKVSPACEGDERAGDVVFIHGLGGDARDTWEANGDPRLFWPEWLGDDLPRLGVWSVGYDASPSGWLGGHTMPLIDRATNLLARLDARGIGERPLVFITHSMGGLLCKELLRQGATNGQTRWEQLVGHTKGVVFLATPHTGADLARSLMKIGRLLRLSRSVEDLEENAAQLRQLGTWFRNNVERLGIGVEAYFETVSTTVGWASIGLVVDESSANPGINGVTPISIDATHTEICRPTSREATVYLRVKRFVGEQLPPRRPDGDGAGASGSPGATAARPAAELPEAGREDPARPAQHAGTPPPQERPAAMTGPQEDRTAGPSPAVDRMRLIRDLTGLPEPQLDLLITLLKPPPGIVPPSTTAMNYRVTALVGWAEGTRGPGLTALHQTLEELLSL